MAVVAVAEEAAKSIGFFCCQFDLIESQKEVGVVVRVVVPVRVSL